MANLSEMSRKEQVLHVLRRGEWVNTVDISNAQVGGSAGTSRIRDLRKEGYIIETRSHPDPQISQYQYRLVAEPTNPPQISGRLVHGEATVYGTVEKSHQEGNVKVIEQMTIDSVVINSPHDWSKPIGRVTNVEVTDDGITFNVEEL